MTDPYITKYGHTFEKNTILSWINGDGKEKCPITKQPLSKRDIFPNRAIKDILDKINSQKIILPQKLERKVIEFDSMICHDNPLDIDTILYENSTKQQFLHLTLKSNLSFDTVPVPTSICCLIDISGSMGVNIIFHLY